MRIANIIIGVLYTGFFSILLIMSLRPNTISAHPFEPATILIFSLPIALNWIALRRVSGNFKKVLASIGFAYLALLGVLFVGALQQGDKFLILGILLVTPPILLSCLNAFFLPAS